ncbi:cell division cycle protein 23 homolog [Stomoxys calcitrans]|uniref:cell division cycle protein 23 homolog n=1 Tax=Stomoxys calcitrans TaxID=35570 RepID=UPI0027E32451|nr:cell division cycle protein 23 homolog [Stomoxys calcitrans]
MEDEYFNVPLQDVKRELRRGIVECQKRGLLHSAKWLAEMNHGLVDIEIADDDNKCDFTKVLLEGITPDEYDCYYLAKSYFDVREYDRAAYLVRNCESSVPRFLHYYATYMGLEKRRLDSTTDQSNLNDSGHVKDLAELLATLRSAYSHGRLDGYGMYLYGVILKALNLNQAAQQVLVQSIRLAPMLWGSYVELAPLITEKEKLQTMHFGGHWMRHFFVAHTYIEMYLNDEGLKAYEELQAAGFRKCVYVTSQMALAYHNKRDVDKAIEIFQDLQEADPYRLDNMDTYSNLLFVKELKTEMAQLAHKAVGINKYRPETCCVIGNYYSIRCDHQMAIMYFQRALKLNPKYLAAWTLMGHEFMELKNTNAAIQSYRKAVEVNKRDYRAWYGLGQAYEILKMHYYSLYYFKIAHQLRPYDSRMLVALGETYEKLEKCQNAIKCYSKACDVGDIEGIAMYKMANLHEKLGDFDLAVNCYILYCDDEPAAADKQSLYHGYMTLANYYESKGEYDRASHYAYKCLESDDRKSEAKSLLKTIENKRSGKVISLGNLPSCSTATVANADTSSDDDMEMELSDYKLSPNAPFLVGDRGLVAASSSSIKSSANTTANEMLITASSSVTNKSPLETLHSLGSQKFSSSVTTDEMSLSESDVTTNTSLPATSSNPSLPRRTSSSGTQPALAIPNIGEQDEDTQSMEMSSISID